MINVICSDAGGAEVISSWLLYKKIKFKLTATGPAIKIFKNKFKNIKIYKSLAVSKKTNFILIGTSVKKYELNHIFKIKRYKIKVIAYLDSWTEYKERFHLRGHYIVPNELWVCDKYAMKIAKKTFNNIPIKLVGNYYLRNLKTIYIKNKKMVKKKKIIFLSSPIKDFAKIRFNDSNYYNYTEDDIFNFFLKDSIGLKINLAEITIQLHPREDLNTYEKSIKNLDLNIKVNKTKKLIDIFNDANIVVGCNSMALVVAQVAMGKKTINILPKGVKNIIPYKQVKTIKFDQYNNYTRIK